MDGLAFEQVSFNESLLDEVAAKLDLEFSTYTAALNATHNFLIRNCKISKTKCGCFHHEFSGFYIYPSLPECSTVLPSFLKYVSPKSLHCFCFFFYISFFSLLFESGV